MEYRDVGKKQVKAKGKRSKPKKIGDANRELDSVDRKIIQLILDNPVITIAELNRAMGYSQESTHIIVRKNAPHLQKELRRLQEELQESAVEIIKSMQAKAAKELGRIAFGNLDDYMELTRNGVDIKDKIPRDLMALLQEAQQTTTKDGGTIRIRLYSKLEALKTLLDGIPDRAGGKGSTFGDEQMRKLMEAADKVMKEES